MTQEQAGTTASSLPTGRREITRIEQTAAVWAAEQIIAEATVRGDLDERTVKALGHFLLRLSEGSDCYVLD